MFLVFLFSDQHTKTLFPVGDEERRKRRSQ
jgi:hypothetical protein